MPKRYRGAVGAALVAAFTLALGALVAVPTLVAHGDRELERANTGATRTDYSEIQKQCASDGVLPGPQMTTCLIERARAAYENEHDQADLHAQQDVAVWTGGVFALGVLGYLVSAVGLAFLYANLQMLQRQIRDDRDAAGEQARQFQAQLKRMDDANRITRENARAQVRAYLSFMEGRTRVEDIMDFDDPDGIKAPPGPEGYDGYFSVRITIKNFGQSPAELLSVTGFFDWTLPDGTEMHQEVVTEIPEIAAGTELPFQMLCDTHWPFPKRAELDGFSVYFWAGGSDVFGERITAQHGFEVVWIDKDPADESGMSSFTKYFEEGKYFAPSIGGPKPDEPQT